MSVALDNLPNFPGLDGIALTSGYVYIGVANQDPQTFPVAVYWDAALTVPATQPLRTIGGYIARAGAPANVYMAGQYSLKVTDASGVQVFYAAQNPGDVQTSDYMAGIAGSADALAARTALGYYTAKGVQRFTANGSFSVPLGVTTIYVSAVAGGGGGGAGGGAGGGNVGGGGGGGGAGQSVQRQPYTVTPGGSVAITIGTAGAGATGGSTAGPTGSAGGNTIVGALVTLTGGSGGLGGANNASSAAGNSGGNGFPSGSTGNDSTNAVASGSGGTGASSPFGGGGGAGKGGNGSGGGGTVAGGFGAGGGGGGGSYSAGVGNGGNGGAGTGGLVIVEW